MADSRFLRFEDAADYGRVRELLRNAGYTDRGVLEALGVDDLSVLGPKQLPALLRGTKGESARETLVRLFILGATEPASAVQSALAPMSLDSWMTFGLLEETTGGIRATVQIRCFEDLLVAWDFAAPRREGLRPDYVMGISASTLSQAGMTVRNKNRRTLDIGTGSGFLAFMAARHSDQVIATDLNPRCVELTRFNVALNGLDNIECREGDLFEPVQGEKFDLVVSNPPYIVSPDNIYRFLHSGLSGDEICRRVAREVPPFLEEGGYCQFLANWVMQKGQDWRQSLSQWFQDSRCDVWILQRGTHPVADYAATWIQTEGDEAKEFPSYFERWMDYYDRLGIEAIGSGLITMRRRSSGGPTWFEIDDAPETMTYPCGDDVKNCFEVRNFLHQTDDSQLLTTCFRISPDVYFEQRLEQSREGWQPVGGIIRKSKGLQFSGSIDAYGADFIGQCNGKTRLADLVSDLAGRLGVENSQLLPAAIGNVRRLAEQGFLIPVLSEN